ncbi:MAG: hypothetical protein HY700_09210 [Gemmatimonadetes bacterium]|nr:hypothetical protein [Gemmatimonadota bacterium]
MTTLIACGKGDSRAGGLSLVDSVGIAMRDPASWPTMTFVPRATEIDSVPVSGIDSTWVLASALSKDMLPDSTGPFALADSVGFQFDGDFNQDDVLDRARVGVYRDNNGDEGSFLLILSRMDSAWKPVFVATEPGEPRFSVLVNDRSGLIWAECLTCGRWRPVYWSEGHWALGPTVEPSATP